MSRETFAVFFVVWLFGAMVGWCAGWVARTEQNRGWHRGALRHLAAARAELDGIRAELADALDELDDARTAQYHTQRVPAAPTVVNVHLTTPLPWPAQGSVTTPTPFLDGLDAIPVLPAREVP